MIVTGAKGTYAQFGQQVAADFTGPGNFTYWIAAIGAVGAVGYIDALKTVSRLFMALLLIVLVLSNKGFFAKFSAALKQGPVAPQSNTTFTPSTGAGLTGNNDATGASKPATLSTWSDWLKKTFNWSDLNPIGSAQ